MSVSSYGMILKVDENDDDTYTQIAGVIEGELPPIKKDKYETKTLDQSTRAKGYKGSFYDGGVLTFQIEFEKARYAELLGYVKQTTSIPVRIVVLDGANEAGSSKADFNGLFESLSQPLPADGGRLIAEVQIQVDGDYTFTAGS